MNDILQIVRDHDIKTFQELMNIIYSQHGNAKEFPKKEWKYKYDKLKSWEKDVIKNQIISNMLEWAMKDPRRTTLAKFYLEAYDRLFFIDKGINQDDDGIVIEFKNESGIKVNEEY